MPQSGLVWLFPFIVNCSSIHCIFYINKKLAPKPWLDSDSVVYIFKAGIWNMDVPYDLSWKHKIYGWVTFSDFSDALRLWFQVVTFWFFHFIFLLMVIISTNGCCLYFIWRLQILNFSSDLNIFSTVICWKCLVFLCQLGLFTVCAGQLSSWIYLLIFSGRSYVQLLFLVYCVWVGTN